MTGYSFPANVPYRPLFTGALLSLAGAQPWGWMGKKQTRGRPMRRQGLFMQSVKVPTIIGVA